MAWREAFAFILKNKSLLVNIHVGGEAKSLDEHAFDKHDKASAFEPELNGVTVKTSPQLRGEPQNGLGECGRAAVGEGGKGRHRADDMFSHVRVDILTIPKA